jgi:hypothetical protein
MKFNPTKLNGIRQVRIFGTIVLASCGLNSCKLPEPERYVQADWTVKTTVTKEDYPVGISLDQVTDEPMPTADELAQGLPNHRGTGALANTNTPNVDLKTDAQGHVTELPLNTDAGLASEPTVGAGSSEPSLPGASSHRADARAGRVSESLVPGAMPEPALPNVAATSAPAANNGQETASNNIPPQAAAPVGSVPPPMEVRRANVNSTPENLTLMAASTARPYMTPRGLAVGSVQNPAAAAARASASVDPATAQASVSAQTPQAGPAPSQQDLLEILQLGRKLESNRKR